MTGKPALLRTAACVVVGLGWSVAAHAQDKRLDVSPYIEAAQVLTSQSIGGVSDTVTYTRVAVGVDTAMRGRNNEGQLSLRYERRIGWGKDASDGDFLSGIARVNAAIVPQTLSFEAGGVATHARVDGNGGSVVSPMSYGDTTTKAYSVYGGPSFRTMADDVALTANYRLGYSRLEAPDVVVTPTGAEKVDVFDDSTSHAANIHAGTKPDTLLPVGLGLGASWYREDISNLDQRVKQKTVRGDVTVPVSRTVAVVGGVGYEKIRISNRDVLRDPGGLPVFGSDGGYVTDKDAPRQIAYDVDGLIWDIGVVWKPSERTAAAATYGHRYGGSTYFGSFAWAPTSRNSVNVAVYDSLGGLGGRITNALVDLPTDFEPNRNPLTGDIGTCYAGSKTGSCLGSVLGSVRSAVFRSRGIMGNFSQRVGKLRVGVGAGHERRTFKAARGTILGTADGLRDEITWAAGYVNGTIDEQSHFTTGVYANWFDSGFSQAGGATSIGATAAYNRMLTRRLSATAAVGLDSISRKSLPDSTEASALVGMRYSF